MHNSEPTGALTVAEFCETYRVGRTFFYEELNAGRLSAIKAGTKTLILKAEAERWARALPALRPQSVALTERKAARRSTNQAA